jgi:ribonuclease PH
MRRDGRQLNEPRTLGCKTRINRYAEGSCIFEMGFTRVHCTASVSEDLPRWRKESGSGWVTAEYRMLPRATDTRTNREGDKLKGRTAEIQRLIGRALRAAVDLEALGPRLVTIDCDVLQADGGTRTASVNGGFVAMCLAFQDLVASGKLPTMPIRHHVAAMSVGIVDGLAMADLAYEEDFAADVDLNLVMTKDGAWVEIQGTAEGEPFSSDQLQAMLEAGTASLPTVIAAQEAALENRE